MDLEAANLETDFSKNRILEIGAAVYHVPLQRMTYAVNLLIKPYNDIPIEAEAFLKHGITDDMLREHGVTLQTAQETLFRNPGVVFDAIATHNGTEFDEHLIKMIGPANEWEDAELMFIDTRLDVPFPEDITTRNLTHLAAEHGFLNPFPHAALPDVFTMVKLFERYPIEEIEFRARSPLIRVVADVTYDERDKAKRCRFLWDPARKTWYKNMKACDYHSADYDFRTSTSEPII